MAREQRKRLKTIEDELEDVKRRLARIWDFIETSDTEMADASDRIREHRERKEKLEIAAEEARALLAERRVMLDSADTFAECLRTSDHRFLIGPHHSPATPPRSQTTAPETP